MFISSPRFRHLLAAGTALCLAWPALPAFAQDDNSGGSAPPSRVGEIASLSGSVSFNGAGSNGQWVAASENYPVSTSDSVYTQAGARASIAVESSRITLAESTELQVTSLDDNTLAATASQGEIFLAISYINPGQSFAITTPRGTVTISQNGNYDIAVGDQNTPTTVTVIDGEATITDPGANLQVAAGQAGVLTGTDQTVAQLGTAERDDFMNSILAENSAPPPSYAPPVVQQMTGVTQLSSYGSWSQNTTYGAVWYPSVDSGWTPYREGHWAYVAPWGYTWVDSEPWGFAPFHYGRWIDDDNRWGWVPAPDYNSGGYGPSYAPVYAPAVVSFFGGFGGGGGVGLSVGIGLGAFASGSIGWLPLGPNEPYYPPYRYGSGNYLSRINYVNVRRTDITNINNSVHNTTIINNYNNYSNRRGATYIDAAAMSRGEQVGRYGKPVPQDAFAKARPIAFRPGEAGGAHGPALPPPNVQHREGEAPHPTDFAQRRQLPPATVSHEPAPQLRPGQHYAGPGREPGGQAAPLAGGPAAARPGAPGFGNNSGFHPPPAPPGQHPGGFNGGAEHPGQPGGFNAGAEHPGQPGGFNAEHPGQPGEAHPPGAAPNTPHQNFGGNPGFHPPPPPPGGGHETLPNVVHPGEPEHPVTPNEAHPAPAYHNGDAPRTPALPQVHEPGQTFHPQEQHPQQEFHPQQQPAYHPQQEFHPQPQPESHPQQEFHSQPQPEYHPQQEFHPQQQQPQFHPQQMQAPPPRPEEQHPQQDQKKEQH